MSKKFRYSNRCKFCHNKGIDVPATWAMQYVGESKPTFTALGWHYRGFPVDRVCDACKDEFEQKEAVR